MILSWLLVPSFAGGGRVGCKLWGHYSGVILPLMRQIELVQCIKCGDDVCFIWKLPPLIACTSLLLSSAFKPMALVVRLRSPEERMLFRLAAFLSFTIWIILIVLDLSWWVVEPNCSSSRAYLIIFLLQASHSHSYI